MRERDSMCQRNWGRFRFRFTLRPSGTVLLARAEPARDEYRGPDGEAERERVGHEADHRGVGERGEPPLPDERPHDEHVHDLVDGLKQVGAERRQREAREVGGRAAAQEVYFPHCIFLCTIETKRAAAAKPWPPGSNRARTKKVSRRLPDVTVRRLYRQLLATSCRTSRGAAPIWNSPISRYKEIPSISRIRVHSTLTSPCEQHAGSGEARLSASTIASANS